MTTEFAPTELKTRLKALGLFGLIACCDQIVDKPWLHEVLAIEERERQKRGLERRMREAHVGAAKPMVDFDWTWPKKIDREAIEELFNLNFVKSGHNTVLVGPNGIGKTMILKTSHNTPSVAGTPCDLRPPVTCSPSSPHRTRLRSWPAGCEVVTRRYDAKKPVLLSTNKA